VVTLVGLGGADDISSYDTVPTGYTANPFPPIQLNHGFGGPNKVGSTGGANLFPYGGFARNGDILQVPYIGAYRIRAVDATQHKMISLPPGGLTTYAGQFVEMNAVTMDAQLADDFDENNTGTDLFEQIGRFCPLNAMVPEGSLTPSLDHYAWADDLFDYLTVQSPADDYSPNVNPNEYYTGYSTIGIGTATVQADDPTAANPFGYHLLATPAPVLNAPPTSTPAVANQGREDQIPVEGLININTAPWRVLATLPMVTDPTTGVVIKAENDDLAKAIVRYRDGDLLDPATYPAHAPFQTVFDLNKVPEFVTGDALRTGNSKGKIVARVNDKTAQLYAWLTAPVTRGQGDLSPMVTATATPTACSATSRPGSS